MALVGVIHTSAIGSLVAARERLWDNRGIVALKFGGILFLEEPQIVKNCRFQIWSENCL